MNRLSLSLILLAAVPLAIEAAKIDLPERDRQPDPVVHPASSEIDLALGQITLPENLEISVWAAEPLFANAVAFDFDEQGRAFFSETHRLSSSVLDARGYPDMLERDLASRTVFDRAEMIEDLFGEHASEFAIEGEVIRLVEDTDGDGVADATSIFADGFSSSVDGLASGVLARKGEVYFTNIPHLWKFETSADGRKATKRESLHHGFGVHFGFIGHDLHGLTMGPDGKLYFSVGDRGTNVMNKEGKRIYYPDEGAVYRCNLDGSELEIVHRGLRNPQELAFDEYGNLFTGDNDCDNGDYERLVHVVEGGDSGWRIGHQYSTQGSGGVWISEGWWKERFEGQAKFLLPPVSYINDGPSGIAYYPGTGLSPEYKRHLFITHFKGTSVSSSVDTYTMKPLGASFELDEHKPFMKNLLPTDVAFGPGGKLYVSDWVFGWGKTGKGRLYAISDPDELGSEIVKETDQLIAEGMESRNTSELLKLLEHANWNVRLESQYEIASRGADSVESLVNLAMDSAANQYARIHATWGLGQIADKNANLVSREIAAIAQAKDPEVRAQALKLLGDHGYTETASLLIEALDAEAARVRFFAAQSLGKLKINEAAGKLIELARENADQDLYLRHAIVMGLVGGRNEVVLESASTDPSKAVRTAALLAYRILGDERVALFLEDSDEELVLAAARAINDAPIVAAFPALAAATDHRFASNPILGQRALNANFRIGNLDNAQALASYASNADAPEALRVEALKYLASWQNPHSRDRVMGLYRPLDTRVAGDAVESFSTVASGLLAEHSAVIQRETIAAIKSLGISGFNDQLYALVKNDSQGESARIEAYRALETQNDPRMEELVRFASQSNASSLRLATLQFVAKASSAQAEAAFSLMIKGSVEERRAVYQALSTSSQPFAERLLVMAIGELIAGTVPYGAQLELIESAEASSSEAIVEALAKYNEQVADDSDPIAGYRFALEGGGNGWSVYNQNQIMACVRCHISYGPGTAAGPNLRSIGFKDREYLLESIVAPNAHIAHGFETTIVTLKNGETAVGILDVETEQELHLVQTNGKKVSIQKSSIANRIRTPSAMPDVFKAGLSRRDLRDVVEFISHLTEDPNAPDRSGHGEH